MRLLFKQKLFSWFDSYDIYDEVGNTVFTVQGKLSWGHRLEIYDKAGRHVGTVKEEVLTFMPRFSMYIGDRYLGSIKKEFTFFKPVYNLDCNGWQVMGDFFQWEYQVTDQAGFLIMQASKQAFNWTDTYVIDIGREENAIISLMIVLAIDAVKCSQN